MPFLDQRYQILNGPRLLSLLRVTVIPAPLTTTFTITNENVVIIDGSAGGSTGTIVLPPITSKNQGRGIFIRVMQFGVDATTTTVQASGTDLIARDQVAPSGSFPLSAGEGRLFIAATSPTSWGGSNVWYPLET